MVTCRCINHENGNQSDGLQQPQKSDDNHTYNIILSLNILLYISIGRTQSMVLNSVRFGSFR